MQTTHDIVDRLSRYRNVLLRLRSLGFARVFSDNLSDAVGISASQVRRDFATFDLRGVKRGGYPLDPLIKRLDHLLGVSPVMKVIIVGCGNIGTALLRSYGKQRAGISVVAAFDIRPDIISPEAETPIYDVRELEKFVRRENIGIAVLAVPEGDAPRLAERLAGCGIQGILNFTPAQIRGAKNCAVHNLNIAIEIEKLFYLVHFSQNDTARGDQVKTAKKNEGNINRQPAKKKKES